MKYTLLIVLSGSLFINCVQDAKFVKFINSFKREKSINVLKFGYVIQKNDRMTKEEALNFVYNGDTTRLYCTFKHFNMETETVEGIYTELSLPNKCIRIDMGNYLLIGYSSYQCQNPDEWSKEFLHLLIVDKHFKIRDSMLVYNGGEYDYERTGLLNPKNEKMFIVNSGVGGTQVYMYQINAEILKFELTKEKENILMLTDDLEEFLDVLGWKEEFME